MKLSKAYDQYGSSMGRCGNEPVSGDPQRSAPLKFSLQRVRLNAGGYDHGGAYWGIGRPLYRAEADGDAEGGGAAEDRCLLLRPAGAFGIEGCEDGGGRRLAGAARDRRAGWPPGRHGNP
jgi:hypothetical protein